MSKYTLSVNGQSRSVDVAPDTPMLWVLRDSLGLVGTKYGCGIGECGACTIHVNGSPRHACQTPVSSVGRCGDHDDRRPRSRRQASAATSVVRARRPAMRVLSSRPAHDRGRAAQTESTPDRRRHRQDDGRQPLSVRVVHAHARGRQARRRTRCRRRVRQREAGHDIDARGFAAGRRSAPVHQGQRARRRRPVGRHVPSLRRIARLRGDRVRRRRVLCSECVHLDRAQRSCFDHRAELRDGAGHQDRSPDDRRRGARRRVGERDDRAGRLEPGVRPPVVGRQRFDGRQLHAASYRRRHGARHARRRRCPDVGRA